MEKQCTKCKKTKPLNDFHSNRTAKDGHSYHCKECHNKYMLFKFRTDQRYKKNNSKNNQKTYNKNKDNQEFKDQQKESKRRYMQKYRKINKLRVSKSSKVMAKLTTSGIRAKLWQRANFTCENCGKILVRGKGGHAIHHKNENVEDNSMENLMLVCTYCHLQIFHPSKGIRYNIVKTL